MPLPPSQSPLSFLLKGRGDYVWSKFFLLTISGRVKLRVYHITALHSLSTTVVVARSTTHLSSSILSEAARHDHWEEWKAQGGDDGWVVTLNRLHWQGTSLIEIDDSLNFSHWALKISDFYVCMFVCVFGFQLPPFIVKKIVLNVWVVCNADKPASSNTFPCKL